MRRHKIVFTGGHAGSTGLAVMEEIVASDKKWELHFVGTKRAVEGANQATFEARLLPGRGVIFHSIVAGRLQKRFSRHTIPSLLRVPIGFVSAFITLLTIRPSVVISFGGFVSVPVVFAAWLVRSPVVIHEQTAAFGLANRISSPFATKVLLARNTSVVQADAKKSVVIGNPVRKSIINIPKKRSIGSPPVVFVTGGSRGSQTLNTLVFEALPDLIKRYRIVHHTGDLDYELARSVKKELKKGKGRYVPYGFVENIADVFKKSDIVVARAGANTVSEIIVTSRPALLMPIPWTRYDEQNKNADLALEAGVALKLDQEGATADALLKKLRFIERNWSSMANTASDIAGTDKHASKKFVNCIEKLL